MNRAFERLIALENEAADKLRELRKSTDPESAHAEADRVLCEFLVTIGYEQIVREFEAIDKWYA